MNLVSILRGYDIRVDADPRLGKQLTKGTELLVRFGLTGAIPANLRRRLGCDGTTSFY